MFALLFRPFVCMTNSQDPAATGETDDSSPGRKRARRSVKEDSGLASLAAAAKAAADAASVADAPSTIALFKRATFRCNVDMCMQKMERQILMGPFHLSYTGCAKCLPFFAPLVDLLFRGASLATARSNGDMD